MAHALLSGTSCVRFTLTGVTLALAAPATVPDTAAPSTPRSASSTKSGPSKSLLYLAQLISLQIDDIMVLEEVRMGMRLPLLLPSFMVAVWVADGREGVAVELSRHIPCLQLPGISLHFPEPHVSLQIKPAPIRAMQ